MQTLMVSGKPEAGLVQRHKLHSANKTLNWIETLNYIKNRNKISRPPDVWVLVIRRYTQNPDYLYEPEVRFGEVCR